MGHHNWFRDLYPGDEYVDWIGWHPYSTTLPAGQDFTGLMNSRYGATDPSYPGMYNHLTRRHPGKPLMLSEFGVFHDPTDPAAVLTRKAAFYDSVAQQLPQFPAMKAIVNFDTDYDEHKGNGYDISVLSHQDNRAAFARLARNPQFVDPPENVGGPHRSDRAPRSQKTAGQHRPRLGPLPANAASRLRPRGDAAVVVLPGSRTRGISTAKVDRAAEIPSEADWAPAVGPPHSPDDPHPVAGRALHRLLRSGYVSGVETALEGRTMLVDRAFVHGGSAGCSSRLPQCRWRCSRRCGLPPHRTLPRAVEPTRRHRR